MTEPTNNVTISTTATAELRTWCILTMPDEQSAAFGEECTVKTRDGRSWRAVKGEKQNRKRVWRIHAQLIERETVVARFVNEPHPEAGPWAPHPWVIDEPAALVPRLLLSSMGSVQDFGAEDTITEVSASPAHKRLRLHKRMGEFVVTWTAEMRSGDAIMPVWCSIVWSDRSIPVPSTQTDLLAVGSKEFVQWDYATRRGIPLPALSGGLWATTINSETMSLQDGAGIPLSGQMLCTPKDPSAADDATVDYLRAAQTGRIVAVWHDLDRHWLAGENTPKVRDVQLTQAEFNQEWAAFESYLAQRGSWFEPRRLGLGKNPNQTGDQHDFGATKGIEAVTLHDPRWILMAQESAYAEMFRGYCHYEQDASVLRASAHPNWTTWAGQTHSSGTDWLGKTPNYLNLGTGWLSNDNQHTSQNTLAAYAMLSADPIADMLVEHWAELTRASYWVRHWQHSWIDSPRAQGRVPQAIAHLGTCAPDDVAAVLRECREAIVVSVVSNPTLDVAGPVKCLMWHPADVRRPVYYPADAAGQRARGPAVSVWEHGLAMIGLYQAYRAWVREEDTVVELHDALLTLARTLADVGCFLAGDVWYTTVLTLWRDEGELPNFLDYTTTDEGKAEVRADPYPGGVSSWTLAGLVVAREILRDRVAVVPDAADSQRLSKLNQYVTRWTSDRDSLSRRTAEWLAAARSLTAAGLVMP